MEEAVAVLALGVLSKLMLYSILLDFNCYLVKKLLRKENTLSSDKKIVTVSRNAMIEMLILFATTATLSISHFVL